MKIHGGETWSAGGEEEPERPWIDVGAWRETWRVTMKRKRRVTMMRRTTTKKISFYEVPNACETVIANDVFFSEA
jgi:hypothetical protein